MRHDVVDLPGDPLPFPHGRGLALLDQPAGALLQHRDPVAAGPGGVPIAYATTNAIPTTPRLSTLSLGITIDRVIPRTVPATATSRRTGGHSAAKVYVTTSCAAGRSPPPPSRRRATWW